MISLYIYQVLLIYHFSVKHLHGQVLFMKFSIVIKNLNEYEKKWKHVAFN